MDRKQQINEGVLINIMRFIDFDNQTLIDFI